MFSSRKQCDPQIFCRAWQVGYGEDFPFSWGTVYGANKGQKKIKFFSHRYEVNRIDDLTLLNGPIMRAGN